MKKYTRDEVYADSLLYFDGDDLAANTFLKYALQDKEGNFYENTPDQMHHRLAKEFARIENKFGSKNALSEEYIYNLLKNFTYIVPQGSPMMGIGNSFQQTSLSNCCVINPPADNMSSIMNTARDMANLYKRRFGVGVDISALRPDGSPVNNSAKTSTGAWSFADLYSYVTRMVGQKSRRGALMITMDVRHPDIEKFVTMKHDLTKVTGANVSIRLRDDFMKAVRDDTGYQLQWPVNSKNPKEWKIIQAKELWSTIADSVTKYGEPGLLFWDNILKYLPAHCYPEFFTVCANPCVTDDTWINTKEGSQQVKDLVGKSFVAIVNGKECQASEFWKTGDKEVFLVDTDKGYSLKATIDHKIKTIDGWCEVGNLKKGHSLVLSQNNNRWFGNGGTLEEGWIVGQVLGDGCFNPEKYRGFMSFWGEHKDYMSSHAEKVVNTTLSHFLKKGKISRIFDAEKEKYIVRSKAIDRLCEKYLKPVTKEILPETEKGSFDFYVGFLKGFFDADGSVQGNFKNGVSIRLSQSNVQNLQTVQRMLSRLGVVSKIYKNRRAAQGRLLPDGKGSFKEYQCKSQHELVISRDMINAFNFIGFTEPNKKEKLDFILTNKNRLTWKTNFVTKVVSVKSIGIQPVYDCSVQDVHQFDANGILVHNCGELPLSGEDSCRLISQNLKWYVKQPFTNKASFDWDLFKKHVRDTQRLSDDLVELELEKLQNLIKVADDDNEKLLYQNFYNSCEKGRRTGSGTHGFADCIARMGIRYDSDEAIEFAEQLYKIRKEEAYRESIEMAKERGAFPAFRWILEKDNAFIQGLSSELIEDIANYGRRNISLLTNAPTGSVSIISQTSFGIEPVFRNKYTRRKKKNHDDDIEDTDFVDSLGDRWKEFPVVHHNIKNWQNFVKSDNQPLPDFFIESDKIDWIKRIEMQAAMQRHTDHSISNTFNLPKGITSEVVSDLYMKAWENDLKGVTVYVDGTRSGVLISQDSEFEHINAPKRPEVLDCDIHHVTVKGEKWLIFVGLMNEKPYEVFGGLADNIEIPKDYKKGKIIKKTSFKHAPNRYDLQVNGFTIKNIVKHFNNPTYQVHTRLTSMALRHGIKPSFLAEQLSKDPDNDLSCFSKALSRTIKRYILDGEKVTSEKVCEQCGSEGLIYQEGCISCKDCGYAKCG